MKLNDNEIRAALLTYLDKLRFRPSKVVEELHIHRGNAIADVVALHQEPHCYEIKGDKDKISRLERQGFYYDQAFRKITLVTTDRNLKSAISKCPEYWGIIIATSHKGKVVLKPHRKAKISPLYNKKIALETLWRDEMIKTIEKDKLNINKKLSKSSLADSIALKSSIKNIQKAITISLLHRTFKS
ncbi:sce7726 family protein [Vreelandella venusta]|uniref:sce7726 family protein n=1 Tax=Vreelandella venusta TaxID=44935 RepID=UPI00200EE177|nr:sce7726 family protein [Halomonas venusta]UQI41437.1 sce7726 family protein [Halomonas venusta]